MIREDHMEAYRACIMEAKHLAKVHDSKYYVYEWPEPGKFQATFTLNEDLKLMGEVYPGGRVVAWALLPGKPGGIRL